MGNRCDCRETGPYLVQVDSGVFWRRHIDHLRSAHDKPVELSTTVTTNTSLSPDVPSPSQSDFVPIVGTEHSESSSVSEQRTDQPVTERRYPVRLNRRPPAK